MIKKLVQHLPGILWAGVILLLCGLPGNKFPHLSFWSFLPVAPDKVVHTALYFILGLLLCFDFRRSTGNITFHTYFRIVIAGIIYGIIIEILQQAFFTGRSAELMDVVADTIGTILGCLSFAYIKKKKYIL